MSHAVRQRPSEARRLKAPIPSEPLWVPVSANEYLDRRQADWAEAERAFLVVAFGRQVWIHCAARQILNAFRAARPDHDPPRRRRGSKTPAPEPAEHGSDS
jgi:hypothetical protein